MTKFKLAILKLLTMTIITIALGAATLSEKILLGHTMIFHPFLFASGVSFVLTFFLFVNVIELKVKNNTEKETS